MKRIFIILILFIMCVKNAYAYSGIIIKYNGNGVKQWRNILSNESHGALELSIYHNQNSIFIAKGDSLIMYSESGEEIYKANLNINSLVFTSDGYLLYEDYNNIYLLDKSANVIWDHSLSSIVPGGIFLDMEDEIFVIGALQYDYNIYVIISYSVDGKEMWTSQYGLDNFDLATSHMLFTNDNRLVVYGYVNPLEDKSWSFLAVHKTEGDLTSFVELDFYPINWGLLSNDNIIFSGEGVLFLDLAGNEVWHFKKNNIFVWEIALDSEENIVGIGSMPYENIMEDPYKMIIFKLDSGGNLLWWKEYIREYLNSEHLLVDSEDNVIVTGYEGKKDVEIPYDTKFFALKLDPDGELLWHETYQPFEGKSAYASDAVLDDEDNIYIAGYSYDYTDGDDDDEPGCGCF